jgi:hypothetical protein
MNKDYFGRPIADKEDDPGKQYADKGKYLAKSYTTHPWAKAGIDAASGKPTEQVLAQAVEAPIRFNTEDKLASSQFWDKFKNDVEPKYFKFKDLIKTDTAKANEFYAQNKEAIDSYPRLNNMAGMYSDLKEKELKDEFGGIIKNQGFGIKEPNKPWLASILGTNPAQAQTTEDTPVSTDGMSENVKKIFRNHDIVEKRNELLNSGKKLMRYDGRVYLVNESGNVTSKSEDEYQSLVYGAQLTNFKRNDNFEKWKETADKQLEKLTNQLNDPDIDELSKIRVQDDVDRLVDDYQKFIEQGGFKKGRKAPKLEEKFRYPLVDPDFTKIEMLLSGTKPRKIRVAKRPLPLTRRSRTRVRRKRLLK